MRKWSQLSLMIRNKSTEKIEQEKAGKKQHEFLGQRHKSLYEDGKNETLTKLMISVSLSSFTTSN